MIPLLLEYTNFILYNFTTLRLHLYSAILEYRSTHVPCLQTRRPGTTRPTLPTLRYFTTSLLHCLYYSTAFCTPIPRPVRLQTRRTCTTRPTQPSAAGATRSAPSRSWKLRQTDYTHTILLHYHLGHYGSNSVRAQPVGLVYYANPILILIL